MKHRVNNAGQTSRSLQRRAWDVWGVGFGMIALAMAGFGVGCGPAAPPGVSQKSGATGTTTVAAVSAASSVSVSGSTEAVPEGMVWIPGGTFQMGSTDGHPDEAPVHSVEVRGFWMDRTEVTNEQFERFVRATGYVTMAERKPDARDFPGVPPEKLVPGSVVFVRSETDVPLDNHFAWWDYRPGAFWRQPEGPGSSIAGREKHPVVHVCWEDAMAYARWASKRLPTEAEWEYAARGGTEGKRYVSGDRLNPDDRWCINIWQGRFPRENVAADGYAGTAPVGVYPANPYGLFDMAGNVWEWCADWYRPDYYRVSPRSQPMGPADSFDPDEPGMPKRVTRGGSFLCSDLYCIGYRPSARMKTSPDTGLAHTGFRCVRDGTK